MLKDLRQILTNSTNNLVLDVIGVSAIGLMMTVALHLPVLA